jgi:glutaredoxin-related protein
LILEFIGGADIMKNLFESGELNEMLKKAGVEVTPPPEN